MTTISYIKQETDRGQTFLALATGSQEPGSYSSQIADRLSNPVQYRFGAAIWPFCYLLGENFRIQLKLIQFKHWAMREGEESVKLFHLGSSH